MLRNRFPLVELFVFPEKHYIYDVSSWFRTQEMA